MSDIYFLKDNEGTSAKKPDMKITLSEIIEKFGVPSLKFLSKNNVSIVDPKPSEWEMRVIVFINRNEIPKTINMKPGFHIIDNVSQKIFLQKISSIVNN